MDAQTDNIAQKVVIPYQVRSYQTTMLFLTLSDSLTACRNPLSSQVISNLETGLDAGRRGGRNPLSSQVISNYMFDNLQNHGIHES